MSTASSPFREFNIAAGALVAWREARGEGSDGIRAVLHVIRNRADQSGKSWAEIIYAKWQFSSMTANNDPQLCLVPKMPDPVFEECYRFAENIFDGLDFDLTGGANHYYATSIPAPQWAAGMKQTAQIGRQIFFKA